jgi:hypothetical protein
MSVRLDEVRRRPLVNVAQCRDLESAAVLRCQWLPARIDGRWLTERMAVRKESPDAAIDKSGAILVCDVTAIVRDVF